MEIIEIKQQIENFLNIKKQELFQQIENVQTEEDKNNVLIQIVPCQDDAIAYVANKNNISLEEMISLFPQYPIIDSNIKTAMYLKMESFGIFSSFGNDVLQKLKEKL